MTFYHLRRCSATGDVIRSACTPRRVSRPRPNAAPALTIRRMPARASGSNGKNINYFKPAARCKVRRGKAHGSELRLTA
jgi:hypothetical protein